MQINKRVNQSTNYLILIHSYDICRNSLYTCVNLNDAYHGTSKEDCVHISLWYLSVLLLQMLSAYLRTVTITYSDHVLGL